MFYKCVSRGEAETLPSRGPKDKRGFWKDVRSTHFQSKDVAKPKAIPQKGDRNKDLDFSPVSLPVALLGLPIVRTGGHPEAWHQPPWGRGWEQKGGEWSGAEQMKAVCYLLHLSLGALPSR